MVAWCRFVVRVLALIALGSAWMAPRSAHATFVNFESGPVRPLALSPSGDMLFAVNTPDNRLAIYDVDAGGLTLVAEVPVGLEPVAVAVRNANEVWVVNHLSDSISIVAVNTGSPGQSRVIRTLHTCDEPRDIVFAGPGGNRAFVTAARRGQNCPSVGDPTIEGIGRALVQVWDANSLGVPLGGTAMANIVLFGDVPRALATDGSNVWAAVFHSGNRTTAVTEARVADNTTPPMPPPPPGFTPGQPSTGLIVKFNPVSGRFEDEIGQNWDPSVMFDLPDFDVFRIDANAAAEVGGASQTAGVGTILFNMAIRPGAPGRVYVTNTEARNHIRFEPRIPGDPLGRGVQGHIAESRVTVINGTTPTARHLNPHIDYTCTPPCVPAAGEAEASLAFPVDLAFSPDGSQVYVAGFGSEKVGIFDAAALEAGNIVNGSTKRLIDVGAGPSGIVVDAANDRLYVMNRIDHTISIVDDASNPALAAETDVVSVGFDPSPPEVRDGRIFLYDARRTSGHGDSACASCHVFGDFDSLAWDLGDPFGAVEDNDNPFRLTPGNGIATGPPGVGIQCNNCEFHPMKGPMTTQTLRGMADAGPMHWRGDRTGAASGGNGLDEDAAFKAFNPAFVGLLGRSTQLTAPEMQAFTDFILTVVLPPNPIRAFNDFDTPAQAAGRNFFLSNATDGGIFSCVFCHRLPFGTDGLSTFEGEPQEFKIAHMRNLYTKVGMFGVPPVQGGPGTGFLGDQVRGFGFLHDGSVATVFDFISSTVFQNLDNPMRRNVEAFSLSLDTGIRSVVGQQVSATPLTFDDPDLITRLTLLAARDDAGDCELIAKGNVAGEARGAVYVGGGQFQMDRHSDTPLTTTALRNLGGTAGQEMTFTCVPLTSGERMGVDRDLDGIFDRRELDCGSDPADPLEFPLTETGPCGNSTTSTSITTSTSSTTVPTTTTTSTIPGPPIVNIQGTSLNMKDRTGPPAITEARKITFKSSTRDDPPANQIAIPTRGTSSDPTAGGTTGGATLIVYNSDGSGETAVVPLPVGGWTALDSRPTPAGYQWKSTNPADAIKQVKIRPNQIALKGGGASFTYTLDEASQGHIAVRLQLGSGITWCADVGPKMSGNPPSPVNNDKQDKFKGTPKAPAPATCPEVP
jgi:DNA-binding beta-propeller fold protein YncE